MRDLGSTHAAIGPLLILARKCSPVQGAYTSTLDVTRARWELARKLKRKFWSMVDMRGAQRSATDIPFRSGGMST